MKAVQDLVAEKFDIRGIPGGLLVDLTEVVCILLSLQVSS